MKILSITLSKNLLSHRGFDNQLQGAGKKSKTIIRDPFRALIIHRPLPSHLSRPWQHPRQFSTGSPPRPCLPSTHTKALMSRFPWSRLFQRGQRTRRRTFPALGGRSIGNQRRGAAPSQMLQQTVLESQAITTHRTRATSRKNSPETGCSMPRTGSWRGRTGTGGSAAGAA